MSEHVLKLVQSVTKGTALIRINAESARDLYIDGDHDDAASVLRELAADCQTLAKQADDAAWAIEHPAKAAAEASA
jgi:Flp pilus assembly protein TadD